MRGTHCLKMLFGVNLELHLSVLLIGLYLIFQSFCQLNASMGGYQSDGLPLSLISSHCSFCFFFTYVDFIICCWIIINLIWFDYFHPSGYVFPFVYRLQNNSETYRRLYDDIFWMVGCVSSNNLLDFGGNPDHDADTGIFKGILLLQNRAIVRILCIVKRGIICFDDSLLSPSASSFKSY